MISNLCNSSTIRYLIVVASLICICSMGFNLPAAYGKFAALNGRCSVEFNYTYFSKDTDDFYFNLLTPYRRCRDNTSESTSKRNLTVSEKRECFYKCTLILNGFVNEDGTFNTKFLERTRQEYKTYSNASDSFVTHLLNLFSNCTTKANKYYTSLQKTDSNECLLNRLYQDCRVKMPWDIAYNSTNEEACGIA